jgi:DNA-binding response OmpR family regulator
MKILYVENHAVFAEQVCRQFLASHNVRVESNLTAARGALAADSYDLMIVDYDLDDGKGDELVRACRVLRPNLKIVAASAHEAGNAALVKAGALAVCGKMEFDKIGSVIATLGDK